MCLVHLQCCHNSEQPAPASGLLCVFLGCMRAGNHPKAEKQAECPGRAVFSCMGPRKIRLHVLCDKCWPRSKSRLHGGFRATPQSCSMWACDCQVLVWALPCCRHTWQQACHSLQQCSNVVPGCREHPQAKRSKATPARRLVHGRSCPLAWARRQDDGRQARLAHVHKAGACTEVPPPAQRGPASACAHGTLQVAGLGILPLRVVRSAPRGQRAWVNPEASRNSGGVMQGWRTSS